MATSRNKLTVGWIRLAKRAMGVTHLGANQQCPFLRAGIVIQQHRQIPLGVFPHWRFFHSASVNYREAVGNGLPTARPANFTQRRGAKLTVNFYRLSVRQ